MANRNFDSRVIIQRLQNRIYSRNLYQNNTSGQRLINNPQTTDGNSSRYVPYHDGAQTEYFRTLQGTTDISPGGIENIPPYPSVPNLTTTPSAPTRLSATPGNAQISVAFSQGSTGGSPITNYEYSTDGGVTFTACSPPIISSPVLITGLTNGTTYSIVLKAVNAVGVSPASDAVSATPIGAPATPVIGFITAGDTQLSVNFTQGSDGGSVITNYEYSTNNGATFTAFSPAVTTSPALITGLTNGTTYQVQLKAVNALGTSSASNTVSGTPIGPPDAPTSLSAVAGNAQLTISFTQGSTGGSAITNYEYSTDNGVTFTAFSPLTL